jgi:hypothetical protein
MKTVVYQSFRNDTVRGPIARCVATVEAWAGARGFAYRFLGDELFERVPDWFRARVGGNRLPMSDLARLKVARVPRRGLRAGDLGRRRRGRVRSRQFRYRDR